MTGSIPRLGLDPVAHNQDNSSAGAEDYALRTGRLAIRVQVHVQVRPSNGAQRRPLARVCSFLLAGSARLGVEECRGGKPHRNFENDAGRSQAVKHRGVSD